MLEKFIWGSGLKRLPALLQHCYCMFFVMLGWNLFAFDELGRGMSFMKALFGLYRQSFLNGETIYLCYNHLILPAVCFLGCSRLPQRTGRLLRINLEQHTALQTICLNAFYIGIFLLSVAWLADASFNPFLYFRF